MNRFKVCQNVTSLCFGKLIAVAMLLASTTSVCRAEPSSATSPAASDENARLRALFQKGVSVFEAGKNEEAIKIFNEAWAIRQTYDIAGALAQAEVALTRYPEAAEHLEFALKHFVPAGNEKILEQMRAAFTEVKSHVATLNIDIDRAGAEVRIDHRVLGVSPLPSPAFVDPGVHTLHVGLGDDSLSQIVTVQAGQEYPISLKLGSKTPASESSSPNGYERNYAPAAVAGSIGAVSLIGSVVLLFEASHKTSQRDDALAQLAGTNRCGVGNPNAVACSEISSLDKDANKFRALSVVGFGVTAAAGLATYLLWPRAPERPQVGLSAVALPSRTGVDVFAGLHGNF